MQSGNNLIPLPLRFLHCRLPRLILIALLLRTRHNIINTQQQNRRFNRSLISLQLNRQRFPNPGRPLLHQFPSLPVNAPHAGGVRISVIRVLRPQSRQRANRIRATILRQSSRDYL